MDDDAFTNYIPQLEQGLRRMAVKFRFRDSRSCGPCDLVQDAIMAAWLQRRELASEQKAFSYAVTVMRNRVTDRGREQSRRKDVSLTSEGSEERGFGDSAEAEQSEGWLSLVHREDVDRVWGVVNSLPRTQRDVVIRAILHDGDCQEIVNSTGWKAEKVYSNLALARRRMADQGIAPPPRDVFVLIPRGDEFTEESTLEACGTAAVIVDGIHRKDASITSARGIKLEPIYRHSKAEDESEEYTVFMPSLANIPHYRIPMNGLYLLSTMRGVWYYWVQTLLEGDAIEAAGTCCLRVWFEQSLALMQTGRLPSVQEVVGRVIYGRYGEYTSNLSRMYHRG